MQLIDFRLGVIYLPFEDIYFEFSFSGSDFLFKLVYSLQSTL